MPFLGHKNILKNFWKAIDFVALKGYNKVARKGNTRNKRKKVKTMTAKTLFATMTTAQLIEQFVLTGKMEYTPELPTVRGWYMDELEERNPEAFAAWLDMDAPEDEDLYKFYKVA